MSKVKRCEGIGDVLAGALENMQAEQVCAALTACAASKKLTVTAALNVNDPRFQEIVSLFQDVLKNDPVLKQFPEAAQKKGLLMWVKKNAPQLMAKMDPETLQNAFDALSGKPVVNMPRMPQPAMTPAKEQWTPSGQEGKIMQSWKDQPDSPTMMRSRGIIPQGV